MTHQPVSTDSILATAAGVVAEFTEPDFCKHQDELRLSWAELAAALDDLVDAWARTCMEES